MTSPRTTARSTAGADLGGCSLEATAEDRRRTRRLFNRLDLLISLLDPHLKREYAHSVGRLDLEPGMRALDLATGSGNLVGVLERAGLEVTGADFSERALARARARHPRARFLLLDLADLGAIRSMSFDLVTIAYALHGMPEELRRQVLAEAARIARRLVLVLDYRRRGPFYVRVVEWLEGPHYPSFVATPLARRLASAGLEVVRFEETSPWGGLWLAKETGGS